MLPYNIWETKSLGFPYSVPQLCPGCGARTCYKGWEVIYKTNEFICRECYQKFDLISGKTEAQKFLENLGDVA